MAVARVKGRRDDLLVYVYEDRTLIAVSVSYQFLVTELRTPLLDSSALDELERATRESKTTWDWYLHMTMSHSGIAEPKYPIGFPKFTIDVDPGGGLYAKPIAGDNKRMSRVFADTALSELLGAWTFQTIGTSSPMICRTLPYYETLVIFDSQATRTSIMNGFPDGLPVTFVGVTTVIRNVNTLATGMLSQVGDLLMNLSALVNMELAYRTQPPDTLVGFERCHPPSNYEITIQQVDQAALGLGEEETRPLVSYYQALPNGAVTVKQLEAVALYWHHHSELQTTVNGVFDVPSLWFSDTLIARLLYELRYNYRSWLVFSMLTDFQLGIIRDSNVRLYDKFTLSWMYYGDTASSVGEPHAQTELKVLRDANAQLSNEYRRIEEERNKLQEQYGSSQGTIQQLREQIAQLKTYNASVAEQLGKLKKGGASSTTAADSEELKRRNAQLTADIQSCHNENAELKSVISGLNERLSSIESQGHSKVESIRVELLAVYSKNESLEKKVRELTKQMVDNEKAWTEAKTRQDDELRNSRSHVDRLLAGEAELMRQHQQLQEQLASEKVMAGKRETALQVEYHKAFNAELVEKEKASLELQRVQSANDQLVRQVQNLEERLADAASRNNALDEQLQQITYELSDARQETANVHARMAELQNQGAQYISHLQGQQLTDLINSSNYHRQQARSAITSERELVYELDMRVYAMQLLAYILYLAGKSCARNPTEYMQIVKSAVSRVQGRIEGEPGAIASTLGRETVQATLREEVPLLMELPAVPMPEDTLTQLRVPNVPTGV